MPQVQVFAGHSIDRNDEREPTTVQHDYIPVGELPEMLRAVGLNYKQADYFGTRQVVMVINPDPDLSGTLPLSANQQIDNLRRALVASGVKEPLVDAIQNGGLLEGGQI